MTIEIYFEDLTKAKQEEVLKAARISSPEEANWDFTPLATIEWEPIDEEVIIDED